ncbi:MAG: S8 family serine peptidase, partial [Armatimonadota bacterium]
GADRQQFAARVRRDLGVRPQFYERFEGYASVHLPVSRYATGQRADPLAVLQSMPGVQSARPHLIMRSHATPNDPFFKDYGDPDMDPDLMDNQYYLFEVNAPEAWDLEKGSSDTVIAIIDSGISVYHEDLATKIVAGYDFVGDNVGWWVDSPPSPADEDPTSEDSNPTVWDPAWGQPEDHGYPAFDIFSDDNERAEWWAANYDPAIGDSVDNDPGIDAYGMVDSGVAHGTIVASLAGAATDNGMGLAGLAWFPSLMPVRVINAEGWGFGVDAADAIYWAVEHGADVLNFSWGFGPMYAIDPAEFEPGGEGYLVKQAIEWAYAQGVIIVASAGNSDNHPDLTDYGDHEYFGDGQSHAGGLDFPANLPQTISVGSTNEDRVKSDFSSYADPLLGEILDVVAPGESVNTMGMWCTSVFDAYSFWLDQVAGPLWGDDFLPLGEDLYSADAMGTSFSAPIVSGFAALLKSRYPYLTTNDLRAILIQTGQDLGDAGYDPYFGYGLLDAFAALHYSDAYVPEPATTAAFVLGVGAIAWRLRRRRSRSEAA